MSWITDVAKEISEATTEVSHLNAEGVQAVIERHLSAATPEIQPTVSVGDWRVQFPPMPVWSDFDRGSSLSEAYSNRASYIDALGAWERVMKSMIGDKT